MNGWIYFIQPEGGGPVKIGFSWSPTIRIGQLQTGCLFKLKLLGVIEGSKDEERELHRSLQGERVCGEWFSGRQTDYVCATSLGDWFYRIGSKKVVRFGREQDDWASVHLPGFDHELFGDPELVDQLAATEGRMRGTLNEWREIKFDDQRSMVAWHSIGVHEGEGSDAELDTAKHQIDLELEHCKVAFLVDLHSKRVQISTSGDADRAALARMFHELGELLGNPWPADDVGRHSFINKSKYHPEPDDGASP